MDLGQCQALFYYSQVVEGVNYLILGTLALTDCFTVAISDCQALYAV